MKSSIIRFFVILIIVCIAYFGLTPTYDWYKNFTPKQKDLANISKKEFQDITNNIELNAQFLRSAIKNQDYYRIALTEKDQNKNNFALFVDNGFGTYTANLNYEDVKQIVEKSNPTFNNFNELQTRYQEFQSSLTQLTEIKKYQEIKGHVIKLGLDIAGGVHFVLGIDDTKVSEMLDKQYDSLTNREDVKQSLLAKNPKLSGDALNKKIDEEIATLLNEKKAKLDDIKTQGIDQALVKIENRVDQFGVSEPIVLKGPDNTIVVELPGEKDIESAKEIFTRVGTLTFQMVNEDVSASIPLSAKSPDGTIIDPQFIKDYTPKMPSNTSFLYVQTVDRFGQLVDKGMLPVYNKIDLSGDHIANAKIEYNQLGQNSIGFTLDSKGAEIFGDLTKNNTNKRLAIVLDNKIQSAPSIREPILGGTGSISGSFSTKEATLLTTILKSGSLPVPLKVEEERVIGPSLGKEEIAKGIKASFISLILIFIFLFVYYGLWGGISASVAQILNLFFILACMAQLGATLTLPGIGAIVLTIGMSVDANVILHERIKEDLRNGYSLPNAIDSGYQSAFKTILDSNLTTFIPGLILSIIGNGPIRGFGITLMIGLLLNLFTAIFVTRFIFNLLVGQFKIKNILWSKRYAKK